MDQFFYIFIPILLFALLAVLLLFIKSRYVQKIYYKPKGDFLISRGEKAFFDALIQSIPQDMYICPKVRIADIVTVNIEKSDKEYWSKLNKITQKHVDFLICKRQDFTPLFVVELDGGSHNVPERALRDQYVDDVFKQINLPIIHVKVKSYYDIPELQTLITTSLQPQL